MTYVLMIINVVAVLLVCNNEIFQPSFVITRVNRVLFDDLIERF